MERDTTTRGPADQDVPRRVRARDLERRYGISARLAGDWLRAMIAAGAAHKIRSIIVARWSEIDAWVAAGGSPIARTRRSPGAR